MSSLSIRKGHGRRQRLEGHERALWCVRYKMYHQLWRERSFQQSSWNERREKCVDRDDGQNDVHFNA